MSRGNQYGIHWFRGMLMKMGSGVWSQGSLMESGILGSAMEASESSIGEGICYSASESILA